MDINLSRVHFPVTSLGPGRRLGIWFQGCSIRCPGCISVDTWATHKGRTTLELLLKQVTPWLVQADGITISGGEPFDQPEALLSLLTSLRERTAADILVYSGYPIEQLDPIFLTGNDRIDALISDPFLIDEPHSRPLRGSDNQRMHLLTDLGRRRFSGYDRTLMSSDKSLDVMFDEHGSAWFAGIPARGDIQRLKQLLNNEGHTAQISVHKARSK